MKQNPFLQKFSPHLIAVTAFAVLTFAYMLPLLQGKMLAQHDIVQSYGMQQEIRDYHDKTGEWSLWTGSMFCGMPAYQIITDYPASLITYAINFIKSIFPEESHIVFLLMLGFYILLFSFTKNPWVAAVGGIAFAFSSINFINLEAGHTSKVRCVALMAPILAGVITAYRGRFLFGAALTAFFLAMQVRSNHFQITYYTMLAAGVIGLYYLIMAALEKQFAGFGKATALLLAAVALGVGSNTSQLWTTYEYSKETIRGGTSELAEERSSGLDKDYAFTWSYGKLETFTLVIPNFMGGASQEAVGENSHLAKELEKRGAPKNQIRKITEGAPTYWGDQPFTSGPTYFGAIVCFLFVFGMFVVKNPVKWAFFGLAALCIVLSWGKNFEAFNMLFFNHFPMYNKFRTPMMILGVANLAFVFVGGLGIFELLNEKREKQEIITALKYSLGITLGVVFLAGVAGSGFYDFSAAVDKQLEENGWPVDAVQADRAAMMRMDTYRSLLFIALAGALMWTFIKNRFRSVYLLTALGALVLFDGWTVCKRYLNDAAFVTKSERQNYYRPSKANLEILKDTDPSYRVLNVTTSTFNDALTSYFHKSIGGYHAAKIRRYQDLIEKQITPNMQRLSKGFSNDNIPVLNMLNMRYIIAKDDNVIRNPDAMGNAWFVSGYELADDAKAEMDALTNFNPADKAIVDKQFESYLSGLPVAGDSVSGAITLASYAPNALSYKSISGKEQLAVFSEVYYDNNKGWKAYLDGKPVEHIRVNYVLRAMRIPAGEHAIEFKFEPKSYYTGEKISLACSVLMLLLFAGAVALELKKTFR